MTKCKKQQRRLVLTLVNTFGKRHEKMAYQSIVNNLVGLGRKVQSLTQQVRNRDEYIASLEAQLAEARRVSLYGTPSQSCSVGVGDGSGNLVVHGSYESIKAVQRIILQAEQDRRRAEAAESKLAELAKQKSVAWIETSKQGFESGQKIINYYPGDIEHLAENTKLFAHPAPAVDLAELVPGEMTKSLESIANEYQTSPQNAVFIVVGWNACLADIMRNINGGK